MLCRRNAAQHHAVGYSGNKHVITQNIDKIAQYGVRFMNHYAKALKIIRERYDGELAAAAKQSKN